MVTKPEDINLPEEMILSSLRVRAFSSGFWAEPRQPLPTNDLVWVLALLVHIGVGPCQYLR